MKNNFLIKHLLIGGLILASTGAWSQTTTFDYTGAEQMYIVPMGVTLINIEAFGAQGGTADEDAGTCDIGGWGGSAIGARIVVPEETLYVYVGGVGLHGDLGGWNGAGVSCDNFFTCAKGGGASDVRQGGADLGDRIIVAGGGGGAEYSGCSGTGGDGGGLNGNEGTEGGGGGHNGGGGTQVAGGTAGAGSYTGMPGAFGLGGNSGTHPSGHAGSGGGGWYGGGGSSEDGHGGGGSSYITGLIDASTVTGVREGHGQIIITQLCEAISVDVTSDGICLGESFTLDGTGYGTITWDGGVENGVPYTPDAAGIFTYNATSDSDDDCGFSIDITVYDSLELTYSTVAEDIGGDGAINLTVTGGNPAYVYDWDNDGTGDFDDTEDLTGLIAGDYVVAVMCDAGCATTETITLGNLAKIEELNGLEVTVYPNPAADFVTISLDGTFNYELSTINGDLVLKGNGFNTEEIALDELAKGMYMINIYTADQSTVIKLVKK
ncbi:MAG: T9SS type A sorting domain-containing protein [Crocinitomix sp.]|nr:T9SS type A sorting domain-containing protein [Crocinitomix sp.]